LPAAAGDESAHSTVINDTAWQALVDGLMARPAYGERCDHHPQAFTVWLAGGGIKPGMTFGATDDFGFHVTETPVHIHDLQATILHCLGLDHERLTFHHAGRDFRLTDVHGNVVSDILSKA